MAALTFLKTRLRPAALPRAHGGHALLARDLLTLALWFAYALPVGSA